MLIKEVRGHTPVYGKECFFAETATLIGQVVMGDYCSVWYNAVLRGDVHHITIGNKVNVQDGAVIHATYKRCGVVIGDNVSIGHNALVHGCELQNNVLVGMGAIVMDECVVEPYSIIATGAVVTQKTIVQSGSVYAGVPAKKISEVDPDLVSGEIERIAENYIMYAGWFK